MGACNSNSSKPQTQNKNIKSQQAVEEHPCIVKVKVSEVKPLSEEEKENFKNTYLSDAYIHQGEEGFEERLKNVVDHMWKRWDWIQNNKEIYVNMLRLKGFTDDNIQACLDGKRPLCFTSKEIHDEFCKDLGDLKAVIEQETGLKNISYIQTGSSVPGYSSNPHKGLADLPSKITDVTSSDVDVVLVAEGMKALLEKKKQDGVSVRDYPTIADRNGNGVSRSGIRNRDFIHISKSLSEWRERWSKKLGGGVQVTFQEQEGAIPPWELSIPVPKRT